MWVQQTADALGISAPQMVFGNNTLADNHPANVAVLVLRPVPAGDLQVAATYACSDGRWLLCKLEWAEHSLRMANTYWPNERAAQARFRANVVVPALANVPRHSLVMVGDFNFVAWAERDRSRLDVKAAWNKDRLAEIRLEEQILADLCRIRQRVIKAYRSKHPKSTGFALVRGITTCCSPLGSGLHARPLATACVRLPGSASVRARAVGIVTVAHVRCLAIWERFMAGGVEFHKGPSSKSRAAGTCYTVGGGGDRNGVC